MQRKQKLAATSGYYGAINILSGYPPAENGRCSQGKANRHKTIPLRAGMSCFSDCGTTIFFERELRRFARVPAASSVERPKG
jgi:hypothetical protein